MSYKGSWSRVKDDKSFRENHESIFGKRKKPKQEQKPEPCTEWQYCVNYPDCKCED